MTLHPTLPFLFGLLVLDLDLRLVSFSEPGVRVTSLKKDLPPVVVPVLLVAVVDASR